jgi:SAM-dependent methyltransferase
MTGGESATAEREFYEGYVAEHSPYHRSPRGWRAAVLAWLPYRSYDEWRFWRRWVPLGCRLLDLGSARGREVFRERARLAVGADLAAPALRECATHYDGAALADLRRLPFPDGAFDCVVSSHVLGHVPPASKARVFGEIDRVLAPGGWTVHIVETDGAHPLAERAKRWPELYRRYWIEPDGHVGLEPPAAAVERFRAHGYAVEAALPMEAATLQPRLIVKWFDNEYRRRDAEIDRLVERARRTLASPARLAAAEIRLGAEPPGPLDRALFVGVAARKPGGLVSSKK